MAAIRQGRRAKRRTEVVILGSVLGLVGVFLLSAGGALLWADQKHADANGYIASAPQRFASSSYAIRHDGTSVAGLPVGVHVGELGRIRITATSATRHPIFIGVARER